MFQGINETLHKEFNAGYTDIEVEAYALEYGSIRIPLKLKKYAVNSLLGISTTFIGGVAVNLVSGNKETIVITSNTDEIESSSATFLQNSQTKRSVGKIARMVADNDSISDLSITYEKSDGQREKNDNKLKKTLKEVAEECEDSEEDVINLYQNTHLEIYGPILSKINLLHGELK